MNREELEMRKLVRESDVIDRTDGSELAKAFNYLWEKYVEQEPCDVPDINVGDMISRQVVLDYIHRIFNQGTGKKKSFEFIQKYVKKLPPINSQPNKEDIHREREQAYMRGYEDGSRKYRTEQSENAIRRQVIKEQMLKYGFHAPDMTVTEFVEDLPLVNPQQKTGHCKDCKWWKDSDGLYRRGSHAESHCPINRREVFEGNGYCYMFDPQESEDDK